MVILLPDADVVDDGAVALGEIAIRPLLGVLERDDAADVPELDDDDAGELNDADEAALCDNEPADKLLEPPAVLLLLPLLMLEDRLELPP